MVYTKDINHNEREIMTTTTLTYDDETMTIHRNGCNHIAFGTEIGQASTHEEAMALPGTENIIDEMFDGESNLIWFQSCTGIKNPAGFTKPQL